MLESLTPDQVNSLYPIIGATLYPGGLIVKRLNLSPFQGIRQKPKRGEIGRLSRRSLSNLLLLVSVRKSELKSMMTLTYGPNFPNSGKEVKTDLNRFLTRFRQVYRGAGYIWFLEFQRRGAPHIHVLLTVDGPDQGERRWFSWLWSNIACKGQNWPYTSLQVFNGRLVEERELETMEVVRWWHNREKAWEGVRLKDGAARYAAKYALKPYQKKVPLGYRDVGRFWGCSRGMGIGDGELVVGSERQIREFLLLKGRDFASYSVLPKNCVF